MGHINVEGTLLSCTALYPLLITVVITISPTITELGKINNDKVVRLLQIHLTSVNHFVNAESYDKVEKLMESLKQVVEVYEENGQMDKKAMEKLIQHADALMEQWQ